MSVALIKLKGLAGTATDPFVRESPELSHETGEAAGAGMARSDEVLIFERGHDVVDERVDVVVWELPVELRVQFHRCH